MRLGVTQRPRSAAMLLLTFLAASMAFAQVDPGSKPAQRNNPGPPLTQVLVVNGTGSPVPTAPQGTTNVAGTVNVGNTPNVNVANTPNVNVANTPSVNVTNSPTVQLGNSPSSPIPTWALDEPGRIPFVAYFFQYLLRNRLRLHFSHSAGGTPGRAPTCIGEPGVPRPLADSSICGRRRGLWCHFFNAPPPPGSNLTSFDHALQLYFDAGQTPLVQINTNGRSILALGRT